VEGRATKYAPKGGLLTASPFAFLRERSRAQCDAIRALLSPHSRQAARWLDPKLPMLFALDTIGCSKPPWADNIASL